MEKPYQDLPEDADEFYAGVRSQSPTRILPKIIGETQVSQNRFRNFLKKAQNIFSRK